LITKSGGIHTVKPKTADYSLLSVDSPEKNGIEKSKRVDVEWLLNVQTAVQMQYVDDASHLPNVDNNGKIKLPVVNNVFRKCNLMFHCFRATFMVTALYFQVFSTNANAMDQSF
jgi:flagellar basal body rod protein FlgC